MVYITGIYWNERKNGWVNAREEMEKKETITDFGQFLENTHFLHTIPT